MKDTPIRGVGGGEARVANGGNFLISGLDYSAYIVAVMDGESILQQQIVKTYPGAGTYLHTGGVVFFGEDSGALGAVDAKTGKDLWHIQTNASARARRWTQLAFVPNDPRSRGTSVHCLRCRSEHPVFPTAIKNPAKFPTGSRLPNEE